MGLQCGSVGRQHETREAGAARRDADERAPNTRKCRVAKRPQSDKAAADKAAAAKVAAEKAAAAKAAADKAAAEELQRRATALGLLEVLTTANIADDATLKKSIAFCDEGATSRSRPEACPRHEAARHAAASNIQTR